MLPRLSIPALAAALFLSATAFARGQSKPTKLIELGWDSPDTKFMRQNVAKMEQLPFDGVVFQIISSKGGNLGRESWGKRKFDLAEFHQAIDDLKATPFHRLTDRFLRTDVTPGKVDWFDDPAWVTVLNNFVVAAQVVKQGGCKGFVFDAEQYDGHPFDYSKQAHRDTKTLADYRAKVRQRGQEWMRAVNGPYPDITVLLCFAYEEMWDGKPSDRAKEKYGLLGDFLDGMVEACTPQTKFVDGWEGAYKFKKKAQFDKAYNNIKAVIPGMSAVPEKYRQHFTAGFGIWMDADSGKVGLGTLTTCPRISFRPPSLREPWAWRWPGRTNTSGFTRSSRDGGPAPSSPRNTSRL